ncbi:MAG TPA: alanine-zipper protein [bacterium]|nr:alanine-zipper protein [bacterium]
MTENEFTYWAFLSYSQQDNCEVRPDAPEVCRLCWGDWLNDVLKTFSIPAIFAGQINARGEIIPERIDPIFQDREEQPGNVTLSEEARQALTQSKCLIVICSPRSAKSLHVNEAVRYFKQLGRGNRILPIVIAGEPHASEGNKPGISPDDECFVPALRHPVKPDGTLDVTRRDRGSIFADARHGADKREILANDHQNGEMELEIARIQLIAGLIGVGFNGLWERELKQRFTEAKTQVRKARRQIQEAPNPVPEALKSVSETSNQTSEERQQIPELRNQAQEAHNKVLEAQHQAREALGQVAEARNQAQTAETKVLEAQQQAQEAQKQLEEARNQVREAQNKVLEIQNLPQDVKSQLQDAQNKVVEAQDQARSAQNQIEEARRQARETQNKLVKAQNQVREAQNQVQAIENQARRIQSQFEEARSQAQSAESKVLEAQQQARAAQQQVEEARRQAREAQNQIQEIQNQTRDAQGQILEARNKTLAARRLTKIFALLAVLAALAACIALWQRKIATEALAKTTTTEVKESDLTSGVLSPEQIRQALRKVDVAASDANQLSRLDELAARIPTGEIPDTLNAAAIILHDPERSHLQGLLLDDWMKTNWPAAFDWSCQLTNADSRQRALEQIIPALAADNFTNTLARLNDLKPAPDEPIYTLLFQHWATHDPVQAIEWRQQIPSLDAGDNILCAIMTVWVDQQPEAALNWVKSQPDSESKNQALETCILEQAKTDVPQALILTESLPEETWRNTMVADLFDNWAAKDLEAATTACQQLPDGVAKEKAWERVLSQRIEKLPASAAESVKNLPAGDYRQNAIEELCSHWADTDAPAALAWAQSLSSGAEQMTATNMVVVNWAHNDPQAAIQFAAQHPELSGEVLGGIADAWSQSDVTAAASWVESLPDGEKKDAALLALASATAERAPKMAAKLCTLLTTTQPKAEAIQSIAGSFAGSDITGAVEWACGLKDDATRQSALSALTEPWAETDPKGMVTYALSLPPGDAQTQYLTAACHQLAIHDLPETMELLKPLSDEALRQNILEQAGRDCDLSQINQAAKFIAALPPGADQKAAIRGLVANWASADPQTAVNWLMSFPETNAQPEQVQSVLKPWALTEPAMAAKWLASLPAGTAGEGMFTAFLEGAGAKYPEYAAQWTQSVTDEAQRQKYQLQIAAQWMKTDPSAALKWIDSLNLPEEIKQSLKAQSP